MEKLIMMKEFQSVCHLNRPACFKVFVYNWDAKGPERKTDLSKQENVAEG
jgi:hypothetical protein